MESEVNKRDVWVIYRIKIYKKIPPIKNMYRVCYNYS
jgi:hypothetical protein